MRIPIAVGVTVVLLALLLAAPAGQAQVDKLEKALNSQLDKEAGKSTGGDLDKILDKQLNKESSKLKGGALKQAADKKLEKETGGKLKSVDQLNEKGLKDAYATAKTKAVKDTARGVRSRLPAIIGSVVFSVLLLLFFSFKFLRFFAHGLANGINRAANRDKMPEAEVHYSWYIREANNRFPAAPRPKK